MAGSLTSTLVVRLLDQVTGPARGVGKSLLGLNKAANGASGGLGARLGAAIERNNRALDQTRGRMVDAIGGFYALKAAIGAPLSAAGDFETALEDIGQKADIPQERLGALGERMKQIGRETNQAAMDVAQAVDSLMGRGASEDVALAAASPISKAAFAYRAATEDLSAAAWAAVDNLKVPADQIGTAIDAMAQAGKDGAFELKDMAQYFPALGAAYQGLGQKGTGAVADLAAALQIVRKGAGDSASAATNLGNVLQKVYAPQTVKAFKEAGVDLRKEMAKAAKEGQTPIEAIANITNKALGGDLSKLGDLFQDAQVQQGMRALIQNMEEYRQVRADAMKASGVADRDFIRRQKTAAGATKRFMASIENLKISIGTSLVPAVNSLLDTITPTLAGIERWTSANPELAAAAVKAAGALIAFKVATTGLTFVGLLGRGGALSMLSIGFNSIGRAAIGATTAARAAVSLQTALGAMSGQKLTGLQAMGTALRGMLFAVPGVSMISGALTAIGGALATVSAPVWLAVGAAVAAVAGAGALLWKYWDRVSSVMSGVGRAIGEVLTPAIEVARPILQALAPIGDAIAAGWGRAKEALSAFGEWIGSFFQREVLSDEQKAQWENAGHDAAVRMIDAIKSAFSGLVAWAADIGNRIGNAIADGASAAVASVKARVSGWIGLGGDSPTATPPPAANTNAPSAAPSGHRATGGNVWSGGSFLVGENEAEIFTPRSAGTITPVSKAGGGMTFNFGDIVVQGVNDPAEVAKSISRHIFNEFEREWLRGLHISSGARS
ncbi:phage tail tape measure protein [Rhizobium grahamii]|uniref:TP901 family phage tail tape measure protein n=1 Tax=Rhizobium grahamii CCGE 502 TaxID=990285 RepID=S3HK55_9HYPH|nr:phage tail tape measure protein [Rhizobium grahamii]EPE98440.1 TP901 family phage tail tape measure protein [Rhizobium grahamii CCGE 502]